MVELCHDITQKALENQESGQLSQQLVRLNMKLSSWPS
jgi:hypothetical protein